MSINVIFEKAPAKFPKQSKRFPMKIGTHIVELYDPNWDSFADIVVSEDLR